MRVHARSRRPRGSGGAFWTSYADMMAGLMLVFGLVMVFSIYQFSLQGEDLTEKKRQIDAQQEELDAKQVVLDEQTAQLIAAQLLLQSQQITLDTQQATLNEQEETLDAQTLLLAAIQLTLDEKEEELSVKDLALQGAQAQIDAAQLSILAQRQQLGSQQQRLEALVGVRTRIIESLSEELRKANLDVIVDRQTGAITMKGAVLFNVNRSTLTPNGMALLDDLIPVYVRTLMQPEYRDFVGEIIIEGHADTDGDFLPNLSLSQDRALAVARYCLQDGFGGLNAQEQEMLRAMMTANGRSWSNPILYTDGTEDKEASRRVEIKFRLKEAEMIDEMRTILEPE
ncbi:MAG: OmpA family protein [Clostridia bacterium]|nr:OmpA family protein [Clostridia bacterium]